MDKLIIFDTTLRDGEQSPGASLGTKGKLEVAHQLDALGVDVIEAGFPIASPGDFEAVKLVSAKVRRPVICGLARATKKDIDAAYGALKRAKNKRIHVFLATSKIHMKYKLQKLEDEILRQAAYFVKYARSLVKDVEFSPEDASRTQKEFLHRVVEAVIDAGATTVNIPDTVGYSTPEEFGEVIRGIKENVGNIDKAIISVHCHNDLGLAVANSLSAVKNGARQVECTINGLGERAGNASLEEVVMGLRTRKDLYGVKTDVNTSQLCKTSRLVARATGIAVQRNKAIVGRNAFAHEAGIHQHGVLKKRITYEIMRPEDVGFGESQLVLGKHSGRHAFTDKLKKMGFDLSKDEIDKAFERFKRVADKKKEVYDDDLIVIVEDEIKEVPQVWVIDSLEFTGGSVKTPKATVTLKKKKQLIEKTAKGDGPVDACYKAIEKITGVRAKLLDYGIQAVTSGKDAMGEVTVRLRAGKAEATGRGSSTDVIEASVKAYLNAVNRLLSKK